jgi:hypothetical protein
MIYGVSSHCVYKEDNKRFLYHRQKHNLALKCFNTYMAILYLCISVYTIRDADGMLIVRVQTFLIHYAGLMMIP